MRRPRLHQGWQPLPLLLHQRCRQLPWWRRGAKICHEWLEHPNERVADYYRDYCKTTAIIQQFSSPNTPKHKDFSERDGRTTMDVSRCMLNGAALPKFLRWKIAANVVFLINRPPSKTIGGDTSYNRISGKHADIFFLWPIGTRPHGVRQAHLALNSRHIRSRHDLHNRNSNFEPISFSDASCSTGNPEKATSTSGSMHFLSGGHPLQCSHLLRQQEAFAPSRAGQLQQSKQTPSDQVHGAPQLDRG